MDNIYNSNIENTDLGKISTYRDTADNLRINERQISSSNFDGFVPIITASIAVGNIKEGQYLSLTSGSSVSIYPIVSIESENPDLEDTYTGKYTVYYLKDNELVTASYSSSAAMVVVSYENWDDKDIGSNGWLITQEGNAVFSNVAVRGELEATTLDVGGANGITYNGSAVVIGTGVTILGTTTTDSLLVGASPNILKISACPNGVSGEDGIYINEYNYWYTDGKFGFGGAAGSAKWTGSALSITGNINATSGSFSGDITAAAGRFTGSVTVSSSGKFIAGTTTNGVVLDANGLTGYNAGLPMFNIPTTGSPTLAGFTVINTGITGSGTYANIVAGTTSNNITIKGDRATSSAMIFTTISGTPTTYSSGDGFYIDELGRFRFASSSSNYVSGSAGNVTVSGEIIANKGSFTGHILFGPTDPSDLSAIGYNLNDNPAAQPSASGTEYGFKLDAYNYWFNKQVNSDTNNIFLLATTIGDDYLELDDFGTLTFQATGVLNPGSELGGWTVGNGILYTGTGTTFNAISAGDSGGTYQTNTIAISKMIIDDEFYTYFDPNFTSDRGRYSTFYLRCLYTSIHPSYTSDDFDTVKQLLRGSEITFSGITGDGSSLNTSLSFKVAEVVSGSYSLDAVSSSYTIGGLTGSDKRVTHYPTSASYFTILIYGEDAYPSPVYTGSTQINSSTAYAHNPSVTESISGAVVIKGDFEVTDGSFTYTTFANTGTNAFLWAGDEDVNNALFKVENDGTLTAQAANFTGTIDFSGTDFRLESSASSKPDITFTSTSNDNTGGGLLFYKKRSGTPQNFDDSGQIVFYHGLTANAASFVATSQIVSEIADVTASIGRLRLLAYTYNPTLPSNTSTGGITILSGSTAAGGTAKVGINESAPSYTLDVSGNINTTASILLSGRPVLYPFTNPSGSVFLDSPTANLRILQNISTNAAYDDGMFINYGSAGGASADLSFYANGTTLRAIIKADTGNFGIGTNAPTSLLQVAGQATIDGNLVVNTNDLFVNTSNQRVGINDASPAYTLDVNGDARFVGRTRVGAADFSVNTDVLYVDSTLLKVGINTTPVSADRALTVAGAIKSSNGLIIGAVGTATGESTIISSGGVISASGNDTANAPGFTWTNDPDTGMYRIGANQLGFATSTGSRFQISTASVVSVQDFYATADLIIGERDTSAAASADGSYFPANAVGGIHLRRKTGTAANPVLNINKHNGTTPITASPQRMVAFYVAGSEVGRINVDALGVGTPAFTTGSDYRLKEQIEDFNYASEIIKKTRLRSYKWKNTGKHSVGFIAHELQDVVKDLVDGEKDALNENGDPEYQHIMESRLIPYLTGALKDALFDIEKLYARIDQLENRIIELENKNV